MPWRQSTPPLSRARLARLRQEWFSSVGFFCVIFTFFIGLSMLMDPWLRTVPMTSTFHRWGEGGVFVIGLVFVGVSFWDTLISTRDGYVTTVIVLSGFGILSALHPLNLSGMLFYVLTLIATFRPSGFRSSRWGR